MVVSLYVSGSEGGKDQVLSRGGNLGMILSELAAETQVLVVLVVLSSCVEMASFEGYTSSSTGPALALVPLMLVFVKPVWLFK